MTDHEVPEDGPADPQRSDPGMDRWLQVLEDVDARAEAYEEDGWTVVAIHPGDVATFGADADRPGITLLAPDNEFDPAVEAVEASDGFDAAEVLRASDGATVYVVVVMEDPSTETALLLPAYFNTGQDTDLVELLRSADAVPIRVRPLDERQILTFSHQEPSLFLPDE